MFSRAWHIVTLYRKIRENYREMRKTKSVQRGISCNPLRISHQGRHLRKRSKDFVVYFFALLIKHEIRMKCVKCIVSVWCFVVCFAKTLAKCEKCIASLRKKMDITRIKDIYITNILDAD